MLRINKWLVELEEEEVDDEPEWFMDYLAYCRMLYTVIINEKLIAKLAGDDIEELLERVDEF